MEPIVNPWVFYLMGFADNLIFFCWLEIVFAIFFIFFALMAYDSSCSFGVDVDSAKIFHYIKTAVLSIVICVLIMLFMPSKDTITQMLIAQNVTYNRFDSSVDAVNDVYSDIISLFEEVTDD